MFFLRKDNDGGWGKYFKEVSYYFPINIVNIPLNLLIERFREIVFDENYLSILKSYELQRKVFFLSSIFSQGLSCNISSDYFSFPFYIVSGFPVCTFLLSRFSLKVCLKLEVCFFKFMCFNKTYLCFLKFFLFSQKNKINFVSVKHVNFLCVYFH